MKFNRFKKRVIISIISMMLMYDASDVVGYDIRRPRLPSAPFHMKNDNYKTEI